MSRERDLNKEDASTYEGHEIEQESFNSDLQDNNNADEPPEPENLEKEEKATGASEDKVVANPVESDTEGNRDDSKNEGEDGSRSQIIFSSAAKGGIQGKEEAGSDEDLYEESEVEVFRAELKPKKVIDPEFTYEVEELVSRPIISKDSGIPENLLTVFHSFGFDALRRENLQLLANDTVCYVNGNYLEILNITTEQKIRLRTVGGVGIGAFSVHPEKIVIAVAERGETPPVCIYRYPNLELYRMLTEGTQKEYSACQFSPDGEYFASVGGDPDYMLTLWDWRNEQIVLRAKAFSQDIYRVAWSADLPGVLTTAGAGHIRFWKMADTFTGLKLQGKLGKFGKTELSDIEGFVILPDGKVLTGSAWGNLLVWEGDLIKVQISRKNKRPCHTGLIMHIVMDEGELMTVGQDGWIRTWDFETVDTAECLEEGAIYELEPMNELLVKPNSKLMHLVKVQGEDSTLWYAQDGDGALWKLDLSFTHTSLAPESLVKFHSGAIMDCVTSPFAYTTATIGLDGRVSIYDILTKKQILRRKFPAPGTRLIWSPPQVDPKGKTLVAGFQDGVVRILQFGENPETDPTRKARNFALLDLGQALKPHVKAVTTMAYSPTGDYFATGSEDGTVFFFAVRMKMLNPIGFVEVGDSVVRIEWIPDASKARGNIIVYLKKGCVLTYPCPSIEEADQNKSFALPNIHPNGGYQLLSIKSQLQHEEQAAEKLKQYEKEKKIRQELRASRAQREPETEEETRLLDEEEELIRQGVMSEIANWAPSGSDKLSTVLYATLDPNNPKEFWLSLDEFDASYLYKCKIGEPPMSDDETRKCLRKKRAEQTARARALMSKETSKQDEMDVTRDEDVSQPTEASEAADSSVSDGEIENKELGLTDRLQKEHPHESAKFLRNSDTAITYWTFSASGNRLFVGFRDGCVRVQLLQRPFDVKSLGDYWLLRTHDNLRGGVNRIALTHDEKFLISVSQDGTFFVYELMSEELQEKEIKEYRSRIPSAYESQPPMDDIVDPKAYSIEQAKQKEEYDRLMSLAEQKKAETRRKVTELRLRFKQLKEQNEKLPERIRLGKEEFNLVPHIRHDLLKDREAKIDLVYRETAWNSEKYRIALEKLENAFRKPLDYDRIVVKSFGTGHCVSSMRTNKLGEEHSIAKEEMKQMVAERLARKTKMDLRGPLNRISSIQEPKSDQTTTSSDSSQQQLKGARGLRVARKLHALEEAQRRREIRRQQWEQLDAMKPVADYEDPEDLKAIAAAKENMGDFKLKSSQNYIVADRSKLNALGAKYRLIEMTEEAFKLRHEFNSTVFALRNKKTLIVEELHTINRMLHDLQTDLPEGEPIFRLEIPDWDREEYPEKEFHYDKSRLLRFKREHDEPNEAQSSLSVTKSLTWSLLKDLDTHVHRFSESACPDLLGRNEPDVEVDSQSIRATTRPVITMPLHVLATDSCVVSMSKELSHCALRRPPVTGLVGAPPPHLIALDESSLEAFSNLRLITSSRDMRPAHVSVSHGYISANSEDDLIQHYLRKHTTNDVTHSDIDSQKQLPPPEGAEEMQSSRSDAEVGQLALPNNTFQCTMDTEDEIQRQLRAMYHRQELLNAAGRLVRGFDAEVRLLRHAQFKLNVLLKRAESHQLTVFEEYRLLKEFEKSELVLTEKKHLRDSEKLEVQEKIADLNVKIEARRKELERLAQREHVLHEEFKASLGEGHRFADFLTKVFKKRIKRKKQEATGGDSEGSDESSSSSEGSSYDESEDESDEDNILDLDTCPAGCPLEDYESTIAIRERRLDVEDEIGEEKKALDLLKKDAEAWTKKQRIVEAAQKQAQAELEAFQLEKQRRLNELDTIVILRMDQIEYHQNSSVPSDLSSGLVFERMNMCLLRQRIRELQEEQKQHCRQQQDAKDKHVMLQKHKKLFQKELEKITAVCDKEMYEKFGRIEDIERMEGVLVNAKLEEMTTKMLILQEELEKEEAGMEDRIREARDACISQIRENTESLKQTLMLFNEKERLQTDLNNTQGLNMGYIDTSDNEMDIKEIKRLTSLVRRQEMEMAQLSQEVADCVRRSLTSQTGDQRRLQRENETLNKA
ncbi:Cilia- and flagella-associated protein 44 [Clonorchis sinensis]|uniref:Cilia- and flagella-associated protein 44 n=1 Tax=Clonorchis sinensis TaxID=79923 RepID=A0A3R7FLZ2_CLOSI|nr:Cilia- and flagella-associated protein 44 [Clonorchis sinensis]